MSTFDSLRVLDKLEVGPVRLEQKRLVAPYTVTRGRERDSSELIYRYEEPVFDPADPASINLASMVAAQVAACVGANQQLWPLATRVTTGEAPGSFRLTTVLASCQA